MKQYPITSEMVSIGHPDKVADYISDSILDKCLTNDPNSRVACEVLVTTNKIIIAGEITTNASLDYPEIALSAVRQIGYNKKTIGFNPSEIEVINLVKNQSSDIALGLQDEENNGAGDQGIVYGYAVNENEHFLPNTFLYAKKVLNTLREKSLNGEIKGFLPDAKSQVTIDVDKNGNEFISDVVVSVHHEPIYNDISELRSIIKNKVILDSLPKHLIKDTTNFYINHTGKFEIGGPMGDTGLTGRKIIVDTYGGFAKHGGGAFSGKDYTKLDRSGAYMARYLAKNLVANGICQECEIQLGYVIAKRNPVSININCFHTNKVNIDKIISFINTNFDLSSSGIRKLFSLEKPLYRQTCLEGHFFGKFPWEEINPLFKNILLH